MNMFAISRLISSKERRMQAKSNTAMLTERDDSK